MNGCPRAGTARSAGMSPRGGRSSHPRTLALASVRVGGPQRPPLEDLSCPSKPRVFLPTPARKQNAEQSITQSLHDGERGGDWPRACPQSRR